MVIKDETEVPLEIPLIKQSDLEVMLESKKEHAEVEIKRKRQTKVNKRKCDESIDHSECSSSADSDENSKIVSQISESDLEELKTVYVKCKSVLKKIEQKYGKLLDLNETESSEKEFKPNDDHKCTCALKKKIVFAEDGTVSTKEPDPDSHICPKRLKIKQEHLDVKKLKIEYETPDTLPGDLQKLSELLHNEDLEANYRNKIINKMKSIKQEHINDIKFSKAAIIEKIKLNPEDVLDFKGTNLSDICGYPMK